MQAVYTETINLSTVAFAVCGLILADGAGQLSTHQRAVTNGWVAGLERFLTPLVAEARASKRRRRQQLSDHQGDLPHAKLARTVFELEGLWGSGVVDPTLGNRVRRDDGGVWLVRQVLVRQRPNLGRMYPENLDYPALLGLPRLVRKLAMSVVQAPGVYVPRVVELDQVNSHPTILAGLLPDVAVFRRLAEDRDTVLAEVCAAYARDPIARERFAWDKLFDLRDSPALLPALPSPDGDGRGKKDPAPSEAIGHEEAKRVVLSVLYGMGLDRLCAEHGLAPTTAHPGVLSQLAAAVSSLPDRLRPMRLPGIPCYDDCPSGDSPCSQTSVFLQSLETALTLAVMRSLGPADVRLYAYDGVYVDCALASRIDPQHLAATASVTTGLACRLVVKPLAEEVVGRGALAPGGPEDVVARVRLAARARAAADAVYDPEFMFALYQVLTLHGVDYRKSPAARLAVCEYFGKFHMQQADGGRGGREFSVVSYDPLVPHHIVEVRRIAWTGCPAELAQTAVDIRRAPSAKDHAYWVYELAYELPRNVRFAHLATDLDHNLRLPGFARLDGFTFDLGREIRVARRNRGRPRQVTREDLLAVRPILRLLWSLVGNDPASFVFLFRVLAARVQHTTRPIKLAVQVSSVQHGMGKNLLFDQLLGERLLGAASRSLSGEPGAAHEPALALTVTDPNLIAASFNAHEEGLLLFVADECTHPSDNRKAGHLKGKITSDALVVNRKYEAVRTSVNKGLVVILTNHVSPLRIELNDRRYFVVRPRDDAPPMTAAEATRYAALIRDEEWLFSLYKVLLACTGTDPETLARGMPTTGHKRRVQAVELNAAHAFVEAISSHPTLSDLHRAGKPLRLSMSLVKDLRAEVGDLRHMNAFVDDIVVLGGRLSTTKGWAWTKARGGDPEVVVKRDGLLFLDVTACLGESAVEADSTDLMDPDHLWPQALAALAAVLDSPHRDAICTEPQ